MKEKSPVAHLCVVAPPDSPRGVIDISTAVLALVEVVIVPLTKDERLTSGRLYGMFDLPFPFMSAFRFSSVT